MKQIIVTTSWDDGHKDDFLVADLLNKYKLQGTFYIAPKNHEIEARYRLTDEDIVNLANDFEIGGHTMTHCRLTNLNNDGALEEILGSKKYLESLIQKKVGSFAYPYGDYDDQTKLLAEKAGYRLARTDNQMITIPNPNNLFELGTSIEFTPISLLGLYGQYKLAIKNGNRGLLKYLSLKRERNAYRIFDYVYQNGGIYHLWGHSNLISQRDEFIKLESLFRYLAGKKGVSYLTNGEAIMQFNHEK